MREFGNTDGEVDILVDHLLRRAYERTRPLPPIDLVRLSAVQNVRAIDLRPMIPTGGLSCGVGGFTIYIRDLSRNEPTLFPIDALSEDCLQLTRRQRFTFAHELGHTLFFRGASPVKTPPRGPKGAKLEALCHRAAARMLIPEDVLLRNLDADGSITTARVLTLAEKFLVSPVVMLHRCSTIDSLRYSNRALFYVTRKSCGENAICAFLWTDWLLCFRKRPVIGVSLEAWLSDVLTRWDWKNFRDSTLVESQAGKLRLTSIPYTRSSFFIEMEHLR